jgi:hypothetical protein
MNTEQVTGRRENPLAACLGAVLAVQAGPARGELLLAAVGQHHHQERLAPQPQAIPYAQPQALQRMPRPDHPDQRRPC